MRAPGYSTKGHLPVESTPSQIKRSPFYVLVKSQGTYSKEPTPEFYSLISLLSSIKLVMNSLLMISIGSIVVQKS